MTLDRPYLLRQQIRGLIRASVGQELNIMFPMVAEVAEFLQARKMVDLEIDREISKGNVLPDKVNVGVMLEVPSLLFQLDNLLKEIDFLSVGSNDLFQFLFAVDRGNPRVSDRYDTLSPAVLNALSGVVQKCTKANVSLSLCGEMGGRPIEAMALIALGFRTLSMSASAVGPVKMMIQSMTLSDLENYMKSQVTKPDRSIRSKLRQYAIDHAITL